jgi:lipopolysaccharide export system protein LptA
MLRPIVLGLVIPVVLGVHGAVPTRLPSAAAQTQRQPLTLRADIQQANAKTGVVTAQGNVQLSYPARQIQATAAQAQYFSRERRIVLSGNVYVLQDGNSLQAETITYLIDEGRFVALPRDQQQVETIILIGDQETPVLGN